LLERTAAKPTKEESGPSMCVIAGRTKKSQFSTRRPPSRGLLMERKGRSPSLKGLAKGKKRVGRRSWPKKAARREKAKEKKKIGGRCMALLIR